MLNATNVCRLSIIFFIQIFSMILKYSCKIDSLSYTISTKKEKDIALNTYHFIHDLESKIQLTIQYWRSLRMLVTKVLMPCWPEPGYPGQPEVLLDPAGSHQIYLQIFLPNMHLLLENCKLHLK